MVLRKIKRNVLCFAANVIDNDMYIVNIMKIWNQQTIEFFLGYDADTCDFSIL